MRLESGQYQRVILRALKETPEAPATPPPQPLPVAAPAASTTTVVIKAENKRNDAAAPATPERLALKWVAWGLGAAGIGVGVYGAVANHKAVKAFNTGCSILDGQAVNLMGQPSPTCPSEKSDYETKGKIGVVGFVSAGVLGVTGLALWLTEPPSHAK